VAVTSSQHARIALPLLSKNVGSMRHRFRCSEAERCSVHSRALACACDWSSWLELRSFAVDAI
jgi:hypothetical protein